MSGNEFQLLIPWVLLRLNLSLVLSLRMIQIPGPGPGLGLFSPHETNPAPPARDARHR